MLAQTCRYLRPTLADTGSPAELNYAAIQDIMGVGLHQFLDEFQRQLNHLDAAIFEAFFASRPVLSSSTDLREI